MTTPPPAPAPAPALTSGQWRVLLAAFLGWLFDGYEIGLFPVIARPALTELLGGAGDAVIGQWMGVITACFLVGAALGGLVFGWLGDRVGRVKAMALSILTYALVTGLGYFAQSPEQLGAVRFVSALGMGGQWSLGVALVMECWPERWRPWLAGAMGAAANVGFLLVGATAHLHQITPESWRWMLLVAALPALLVVFIVCFVPESPRWQAARAQARQAGEEILHVILYDWPLFVKTTLAVIFASVALIGTWGSVQWLPLWANQMAAEQGLQALRRAHPEWYAEEIATQPPEQVKARQAAEQAVRIKAGQATANMQMVQGLGAIVGTLLAPLVGARLGRRPTYFLLCLCSLLVCGLTFRVVQRYSGSFLLWGLAMSFTTASFYGWFPLYLPELFPTRVRATGQGLSYNFGRLFAAVGALTQGQLVAFFDGSYARAGAVVTSVYLLGMAVIWLAPETKGKPLPE